MEVLVSCGIMAAAALTTSMFHARTQASAHAVRLAAQARSAVINAREELGSWPPAELSIDRIEQLPIPDEQSDALPEAHWNIDIQEVDEPIHGKRIFIDLEWRGGGGQRQSTSGITFWVNEEPGS
jgi:hypothetical protein